MKIILLTLIFLSNNSYSQVSFLEFEKLKTVLQKAFKELRRDDSHKLVINKKVDGFDNYWWKSEQIHASYVKMKYEKLTEHNIFLFGGYIRLNGMTLDGLAVTACHEIGHGIGGYPFKTSGSSTEGQADYFSTKTCLPVVFKYLNANTDQNNYFDRLCSNIIVKDCVRKFSAIQSTKLFLESIHNSTLDYYTPSNLVVETINLNSSFYPSPQCRLDTLINGILDIERPACWYANGVTRDPF